MAASKSPIFPVFQSLPFGPYLMREVKSGNLRKLRGNAETGKKREE